MIKMYDGIQLHCSQCNGLVKREWLNAKNGALRVGASVFCSEKCKTVHFATMPQYRQQPREMELMMSL